MNPETELRLRLKIIASLAESSLTTWPSALRIVSGLGLMTRTSMVAVAGTISERFESAPHMPWESSAASKP